MTAPSPEARRAVVDAQIRLREAATIGEERSREFGKLRDSLERNHFVEKIQILLQGV